LGYSLFAAVEGIPHFVAYIQNTGLFNDIVGKTAAMLLGLVGFLDSGSHYLQPFQLFYAPVIKDGPRFRQVARQR
jgi:hypothetical protein